MASIADIRQGLATNLTEITGIQASAYVLASPTLPSVEVFPPEITYGPVMQRGIDEHVFTVRVSIADVSDISSQKQLDEYMESEGDRSIKQKLEADKTLGGACSYLRVTGCSGTRRATREGAGPVLITDWRVEVGA